MQEDEVEEDKKMNMGEGCSTADLAPKQEQALWETMLAVPQFWVMVPSNQVARKGLAASSRAWGKVLAV